jgi:hypothetical protein
MRTWPRRTIATCAALGVLFAAGPARASIDFGDARRVGPPSTWNGGNGLAHTSGFLVTAWASDCPPPHGACATDDGPYMGVFVQRARLGSGAPSWGKPVRVSQRRQQAARPTIAAQGDTVVAGWVTQTSYRHDAPRKRRVFYVRRGRRQGRRWGPAIRMSAGHGRVADPELAASGGAFYATWTNANTGDIRVSISIDRGVTWRTQTVGSTRAGSPSGTGFHGEPSIGASGANVVVAWFANDAGAQVAKVSNAGGSDLAGAPEMPLTGSSPNEGLHYPDVGGADDGASHDVAVAYTTSTGIGVRTYDGGSLGNERSILDPWPQTVHGLSYDGAYGPSIQPYGSGGLAVAFAGCRSSASLANDCRPSSHGRIDLLYAESTDGGHSWAALVRLADSSKVYRINDEPSVVFVRDKRDVLFNRYDPSYRAYDLALRIGSGTP